MRVEEIFLFCLIFLPLGIISSIVLSLPVLAMIGLFISLILFILKKEKAIIIIFVVFLLGAIRADVVMYSFYNNRIEEFHQKEVVVSGKIIDDPVVMDNYQRIKVKTNYINKAKITVIIYGYFDNQKEFSRGDRVILKGNFKNVLEDKNTYYRNQGVSATLSILSVAKVKPSIFSIFTQFKNYLRDSINENMKYPFSTILSAMILGDNYGLTQELKDSLNNSGLRHIISISGTHITIIMSLLMTCFLFFNISRKKSGIITLIIILLYIVLIGFYAPAIRASIMGASIILAQIFSRQPDAFRFLLFSGSLMLFIDPFLFFDPGFWLSFTATSGMIFFSSYFTKIIRKIFINKGISQILGITFSAQIFSLPILLYYFGSSSILAFISNILVAPVVPLIISFGFLSLLLSTIFNPIALLSFILVQLLLSYLVLISNFIAKFSFLSLNFFPNIFLVLATYILLIMWARRIKQNSDLDFLEY